MSDGKDQKRKENEEREAKRKEANRRYWRDNERRWNKLYGRPMRRGSYG